MNESENLCTRTISRRKFLWMAAVGLLAACCPSPQQADTGEKPAAADPTGAPAATSPSSTQTPVPTEEPESAGDLPAILGHLHWLGHASFRLDGPPTVYFDPVDIGSEPPRADIVLISHSHGDHLSMPDIKLISGPETVIITIPDIAGMFETSDVEYAKVWAAQPGERMTVGDVEIETVPAYNVGKSYHPKEAGYLGFIVTLQGERLYFAGDTDHIPEMADIDCDVALLPVGGTYTMNLEEAAQAAADIGPKVAVPMHDRGADLNAFGDLCDCPVVVMEID
jgi:L-ascorbate metabolism protein UlaG (beta-lactamase superfamily)